MMSVRIGLILDMREVFWSLQMGLFLVIAHSMTILRVMILRLLQFGVYGHLPQFLCVFSTLALYVRR